jgi:hypothetical protein
MPEDLPRLNILDAADHPDWYFEGGFLVYTAAYHLKRGYCCGSGCRHCPYEPKHVDGSTKTARADSIGGS